MPEQSGFLGGDTTVRSLPPELETRIRAQQKAGDDAIASFVRAVKDGDATAIAKATARLESTGGHDQAFRSLARVSGLSERARTLNLSWWIMSGDDARYAVNSDRILIKALRNIIPNYKGPELTLYRGASAGERRFRRYGMSWTRSLQVAESFAQSELCRSHQGGSVVLSTTAPLAAIVTDAAAHTGENSYDEEEIIVDRTQLERFVVVERYPFCPLSTRPDS